MIARDRTYHLNTCQVVVESTGEPCRNNPNKGEGNGITCGVHGHHVTVACVDGHHLNCSGRPDGSDRPCACPHHKGTPIPGPVEIDLTTPKRVHLGLGVGQWFMDPSSMRGRRISGPRQITVTVHEDGGVDVVAHDPRMVS